MKVSAKTVADRGFALFLFIVSAAILVMAGALVFELVTAAQLSMAHFGLRFLISRVWNPVHQQFGALPFLYGTVVSAVIGLLLATLVGVGTALFLTQYAQSGLARTVAFMVDLLAAIPGVVYGLWGIFVLGPWLRTELEPLLHQLLFMLPLFQGPQEGIGMMAAGLILAMMTLPTITAIVREVLTAVPDELREAALALGATKQEMISMAVLPFARSGIAGAVMLGLGRALGETMAVTMVIGNRPQIVASLFAPAYTLASVLANEFTEATSPLYLSALYEIGLILLLLTVIIYGLARLLIWRVKLRAGAVT